MDTQAQINMLKAEIEEIKKQVVLLNQMIEDATILARRLNEVAQEIAKTIEEMEKRV